jgi:hypothetical protein
VCLGGGNCIDSRQQKQMPPQLQQGGFATQPEAEATAAEAAAAADGFFNSAFHADVKCVCVG